MSIGYKQPKNLTQLKAWWKAPSGYKEVLAIAGPLVLSTSSVTIQQFIDRVYLSWYSDKAFAASLPAGMFSFMILCFFIGTASYVNTFVAQFKGAGQSSKVASAVWQSIYFSLIAGIMVLAFIPLADDIFKIADHPRELQVLEVQYFKVMIYGGFFAIFQSAVSGFFTGLGKVWTVLYVNIGASLINIVLDYVMIFGKWGCPEMGIQGAAIATVIASIFSAVVLFILFLNREHRIVFNTLSEWRFNRALFVRMMRFGTPSGLHFMMDLISFSLFVMLVGRLGTVELGATNLAFQVNTIAFLPMIGFSIATSILVGQRLGENKPLLATRATWSAFHMTLIYMVTIAVLYVIVPNWFIMPFAVNADPVTFKSINQMAVIILRFVALYSLFDTFNLIFASALKGAGDTVYVMFLSLGLGMGLMVVPTWLVCTYGGGIYGAWTALTAYVIIVAFSFFFRFKKGNWRSLRVIDTTQSPDSVTVVE
ncbi:MAG: MATE family efflux transporter [Armatimonadota bacterium]